MKYPVTMPAHSNPFRSERVEALHYRAEGVSAADIIKQCRVFHHGRGALTGPKGSGKTTLLLEIAAELHAEGTEPMLVRLNESNRRVDWEELRRRLGAASPPALLLDGAEQLRLPVWWRLRWLARRAPLLIITTHCTCRLPLLHRHLTSPELLSHLVCELQGGTIPATIPPPAQETDILFARHNGDIRLCLRDLYDRASGALV